MIRMQQSKESFFLACLSFLRYLLWLDTCRRNQQICQKPGQPLGWVPITHHHLASETLAALGHQVGTITDPSVIHVFYHMQPIQLTERIHRGSCAIAKLSSEVAKPYSTACVKMGDVIIIPPGAQVRISSASLQHIQVVVFPLCICTVQASRKFMDVLTCRFTDEHSLHRWTFMSLCLRKFSQSWEQAKCLLSETSDLWFLTTIFHCGKWNNNKKKPNKKMQTKKPMNLGLFLTSSFWNCIWHQQLSTARRCRHQRRIEQNMRPFKVFDLSHPLRVPLQCWKQLYTLRVTGSCDIMQRELCLREKFALF